MNAPVRQLALERVGLDDALGPCLLAFLLVLDRDESAAPDSLGERRDEIGFGLLDVRLRCLAQLELAERLLELLAHAVEGGVRVRGDHRPDELEREADRSRLERGQARGMAESVAVEFLVDVHLVPLERGVDGVTAAAEVDEVQELQVLFE